MSAIAGKEWNVQRGYFNTALRGIPPRASVEAARRTIELWSRGDLDWVEWLDDVERVRSEFAALIGIPPARIGVGHTTRGACECRCRQPQTGFTSSRPGKGAQFKYHTLCRSAAPGHRGRHRALE